MPYVDQGIYKVKLKVALNEERKKLHGFSFSIKMANSEAFWGVKKFSANLSFLKCEYSSIPASNKEFLHE